MPTNRPGTRNITAHIRDALRTITARNENHRFNELVVDHGGTPDHICRDATDSAIRTTAQRCAASEDILLNRLATLIDQATTVVSHVHNGGPQLDTVTTQLADTAEAITRLVHNVRADRHLLAVLRTIIGNAATDDPNTPATADPDAPARWTVHIDAPRHVDLRDTISTAMRGLADDLAAAVITADVTAYDRAGDAFNDWASA